MDKNSKGIIEKDAVCTEVAEKNEVTDDTNATESVERYNTGYNQNQSAVNNNNNTILHATENQNALMMTFNGCQGISIGNSTSVNLGWSPGMGASNFVVADRTPRSALARNHDDESIYRKTPTIKKMMENDKPIPDTLLDNVCANLGFRWREVTVQLHINELFVDQMYIDHFDRFGIREVVFQILKSFLRDNPDKSTIGWLTTFLWRNGFRKTVWTVKDYYKEMIEMENDD